MGITKSEIKIEKSMHQKFCCSEISDKEYRDYFSQIKGYKSYSDYCNERHYLNGTHKSMMENKNCALYLGVYVAERFLALMWDNVIRMPFGNIGFDFICGRGFKIDVKSACLSLVNKEYYLWSYGIDCNKIADYFLLLAFDNRDELNPKHIWLVKSDEIIRGRRFNKFPKFSIMPSFRSLYFLKEYEQFDKLDKLIECCNIVKV